MKRIGPFLVVLLAALAAGCVGRQTVSPDDVYYRLPRAASAPHLAQPLLSGRLGVDLVKTSGLYQGRALLYADVDRPYELRSYHYHHWADSPAREIREHLTAYLRTVGAANAIVRNEPGMEVDAAISSRLIRFERVVGPRVVAAVTMELSYREPSSGRARLTREYRVARQAADATMIATVDAFAAGLCEVYERFLRDLADAP